MKKLLALLLVLVMCVGVLAACKKDEAQGPSLEQAKEYLNSIMKSNNGMARPNDYDVVGKVIIDGTSFEVTWTTDNESITVKPSTKANLWTIDLPDVNTTEVTYNLTATIKAADGSTTTVTFTPILPVIDSTGVTTAPEAGVAYKIFFEQVNLGYTLYALSTTQNNQNKFINATLDPKEAADFYVEVVEGGYKIYTTIDGVKNYVHATATPKTTGNGFTKTIGFATETDSVFYYNSDVSTFMVDINGNRFGVGTYNAFETISISESSYFTADKINVKDGQFPISFMTSAYAETLQPDEKPVANDPAPNSTLTIAEAIALGNTKVKDQYTEGKYYVTGVVKEIQKADYGNLIITDGTKDILVYGTYDATGTNRYDAMANPPQVGDTITVYGIIGMYNAPQIKNGWVTAWTAGEGGGNQGGNEGGETPDPTPSVTLGVVDAPVAGTAYKFGMVQQNVNNTIYYLAGGMSSYYLATTSDASAALDVYLETTEGGYYLYCYVGETKTYINMVVSGTHVNGAYEATASTVYTYDANSKTIKAVVNNEDYWFGTRNDNTYTTMGPCAVSYAGFYGQFYAEVEGDDDGGETPEVCEHNYVDGVCSLCGEADPDYVAPHDCTDSDGDFACDTCETVMAPEADSTLTIEQALALGALFAKNSYTEAKYYVTGTITSVYQTTYGNMYITDGTNTLTVYGTYDATGANRYDAMSVKPVAGDTVTVYGIIGAYNAPQMKDGWITAHTAHEHIFSEVTCTEDSKCTICNAKGEEATGHSYTDGVCTVCGAAEPVLGESVTVSTTIANYADANAWADATVASTIVLDENVTVTASAANPSSYGQNTGKYYINGENWRIYQNENPSVTITAAEGKTIVSVKITYAVKNTGTLTLDGTNIASGTVVEVNASSVTFSVGNTGSATNGQAQITAIEVVYA